MGNDIFFYRTAGENGYLSNFYRSPFPALGRPWPTVEHFYQAMKTHDLHEQERIRALPTPAAARREGQHLKLIEGWDTGYRDVYMAFGVMSKFLCNPIIQAQLLATGDAILHEDGPHPYWGYAKGKGEDKLGQVLMSARKRLREPEGVTA